MKKQALTSNRTAVLLLAVALSLSLFYKVENLAIGSPYVTIDDNTMYEAGFLVWFGQAPPQRTYLESWLAGAVAISTYLVSNAGEASMIGVNVIADAYRDFYQNPEPYVYSYRLFSLVIDLSTAVVVFFLARLFLKERPHGALFASFAAGFYLLSFNTIWSNVVARPDTLTAFLSSLGLLFYYSSNFGERRGQFILSALFFGLATGVKLHGAFFVIFVFLDTFRREGIGSHSIKLIPYGFVSVSGFLVAAGSTLFDPLTYIKLRLLNIRDDASPWIEQGEQFWVLLDGSGWLVLPLLVLAVFVTLKDYRESKLKPYTSVLFLALCWILLFASIRQLRAYWMLPALPLLYVGVVYYLSTLSRMRVAVPLLLILFLVFSFQSHRQYEELQSVEFDELNRWIEQNVAPDQRIFIAGHEALGLPLSTENIALRRNILNAKIEREFNEGSSFTLRHIKLWEERAKLMLYSMLDYKTSDGFDYLGFHSTPLSGNEHFYGLDSVTFIIVQEHFPVDDTELGILLDQQFEFVDTYTSAGGGGSGLLNSVYRRRAL